MSISRLSRIISRKSFSRIVFLEASLEELTRRVTDFATRGLARAPGQGFAELFAERQPLYHRHAELTVPSQGASLDRVADRIVAALALV